MADILNALNAGGFPILLFVFIVGLWRELVRSRIECEGKMAVMQRQQVENVAKIAALEGQIMMLSNATFNYRFQQQPHQQPPESYPTNPPKS